MPHRLGQLMRDVQFHPAALKELRSFPEDPRDRAGFLLFEVQLGKIPEGVEPLFRHKGHMIYEIKADDPVRHDTYRVMTLIDLPDGIYAIHAFQKKSKQGKETPQKELDLVRQRADWAIAESQRNRKAT